MLHLSLCGLTFRLLYYWVCDGTTLDGTRTCTVRSSDCSVLVHVVFTSASHDGIIPIAILYFFHFVFFSRKAIQCKVNLLYLCAWKPWEICSICILENHVSWLQTSHGRHKSEQTQQGRSPRGQWWGLAWIRRLNISRYCRLRINPPSRVASAKNKIFRRSPDNQGNAELWGTQLLRILLRPRSSESRDKNRALISLKGYSTPFRLVGIHICSVPAAGVRI